MLERLFSSRSLRALETMLGYASERQRVIAANLANVETRGYRTRDLSEADFGRALERAFAGGDLPAGLDPREADEAGALKPGGNNVDLELEVAKMARNTLLHSTAAALLAHQFSLLREAISGRVNG